MTAPLFQYPATARLDRPVPKTRIYAHAKPGRRVRNLITARIAQIVWRYKLAPETINLPAVSRVPEIQVFMVELKPETGQDLEDDALRCIDKAVPFPVIFELNAERAGAPVVRAIAAYKRPSEAAAGQWVTGDYFGTDWLSAETPRVPLPVAVDLGGLYEQMLRRLAPLRARPGESMEALAERQRRIAAKQRERAKLETQLRRARQFNRKVEINAALRAVREELDQLTMGHD